jgi:hypothetical protein
LKIGGLKKMTSMIMPKKPGISLEINLSRIETNHLEGHLKIWCKKNKPLQQESNNLEEQIKAIQGKPIQQQNHTEEMALCTRYEQTLTKLTDSYVQRAKKTVG